MNGAEEEEESAPVRVRDSPPCKSFTRRRLMIMIRAGDGFYCARCNNICIVLSTVSS
jgi:hypothetical protein